MKSRSPFIRTGLTLIELLVLILIVVLLFVVISAVASRFSGTRSTAPRPEVHASDYPQGDRVPPAHKYSGYVRAVIDDPLALMPEWYRLYCVPVSTSSGGDVEILGSQYLFRALAMGLVAYPSLLIVAGAYRSGRAKRQRDHDSPYYDSAGWVVFFQIIGAFVIPCILGFLLHLCSWPVSFALSGDWYYLPWHFSSFWLHLLTMGAAAYYAGVSCLEHRISFVRRSEVKAASPVADRAVVHPQSKARRIARAATKAFIVAIASGLGAKVGGWFFGVVAAVIAAVFAVASEAGPESPSSPE